LPFGDNRQSINKKKQSGNKKRSKDRL
jgi:hypothetical protein